MEKKECVAIKDDLLSKPLWPLEKVRLMGTRCQDCGEVYFGASVACQRCQSERMESIPLGTRGKLYSFTINRGKPPGDYRGADPFEPFAVGLVELPEGIRVLSPIAGCDLEDLKIGMELDLSVRDLYQDDEGRAVVCFSFKPAIHRAEVLG